MQLAKYMWPHTDRWQCVHQGRSMLHFALSGCAHRWSPRWKASLLQHFRSCIKTTGPLNRRPLLHNDCLAVNKQVNCVHLPTFPESLPNLSFICVQISLTCRSNLVWPCMSVTWLGDIRLCVQIEVFENKSLKRCKHLGNLEKSHCVSW